MGRAANGMRRVLARAGREKREGALGAPSGIAIVDTKLMLGAGCRSAAVQGKGRPRRPREGRLLDASAYCAPFSGAGAQ